MGSFLETYNLYRVWRLNLKDMQLRFDNGFLLLKAICKIKLET